MAFTLASVTELLGVPAITPDRSLARLSALGDALPDDLSFIADAAYMEAFVETKAMVVIAPAALVLPESDRIVLRVEKVEQAIDGLLAHLAPPVSRPEKGVHASAIVAPDAKLGTDVAIGPNVVIGQRCTIGDRAVLHTGVALADDVVIGADCEVFANVSIRERCTLGARVIIHANSVLGTDGFGYRWAGNGHRKIPHVGGVVVEDDVEIGSCTTVDRGKFGDTRIGRGSKIDNLVQIAHNCTLGPHCIMAGQSGLAGSVTLGTGVVIGGGTCIKDHVTMGDRAMAGGMSGVHADVEAGKVVIGTPAIPQRQFLRQFGVMAKLPQMRDEVNDLAKLVMELQEKVARLEAGASNA